MQNDKPSSGNNAHLENSLFDNPKNVKRVMYLLYGGCALLLALDFVIHRHVVHSWENLFGFYPLYGFVGCVILVLVATWMRTFLMRPEDYYEKSSEVNDDE
ncbi:MAG: hypothetical protein ACI9NY_001441 [Kiritimatiellia bacterium]|jgi:hypothetical protein